MLKESQARAEYIGATMEEIEKHMGEWMSDDYYSMKMNALEIANEYMEEVVPDWREIAKIAANKWCQQRKNWIEGNLREEVTSAEFQRMAPGKVVGFNIQNRKSLGKKDKYNKLGESKINPEDLPFAGPNNVIDYLKKWSKFENVEPFQHSENNRGFYFEANGQRYRVYKETPQMPRKWQGYVIETGEDRISDRTQLYRGAGYTELLADLSDLQKEALGKTLYEGKKMKESRTKPYDTIGVEIQTSLEDGTITESEANSLMSTADIKIGTPDIPYVLEGLKKKGVVLEDVKAIDYGPEKFDAAAEDLGFDGTYKITVNTESGWEDLYYGWNYASSKLVALKKVTTLALAERRKR